MVVTRCDHYSAVIQDPVRLLFEHGSKFVIQGFVHFVEEQDARFDEFRNGVRESRAHALREAERRMFEVIPESASLLDPGDSSA